jgi:hypothetical protein
MTVMREEVVYTFRASWPDKRREAASSRQQFRPSTSFVAQNDDVDARDKRGHDGPEASKMRAGGR